MRQKKSGASSFSPELDLLAKKTSKWLPDFKNSQRTTGNAVGVSKLTTKPQQKQKILLKNIKTKNNPNGPFTNNDNPLLEEFTKV